MTLANFQSATPTVCMFPGLGAEYPYMLPAFCRHYPWAYSLIAEWEDFIGMPILNNEPSSAKDKEYIWQVRIHCLNLLWWREHRSKIHGKIICCGHSLGFYAALVAAGVLSEKASLFWLTAVFNQSWQSFSVHPKPIEVLTTTVQIDSYRLAKQFGVEVIARNSPQQIVVHGDQADVDAMCDSLDWATLRRSDLGSVIPFHSIEMCRVSEKLLETFEPHRHMLELPIHEIWSHLDGKALESTEACYSTLLEQPMRTVNWQLLIQNLMMYFQPQFIEIGPNRILSQLVRWICPMANVTHVDYIRKQRQRISGEAA